MLASMGETRFFARAVAPLAVVLALSGTFSTYAWADAASDLDAGEAAYAALDYDKANTMAQKVVATHGLTHDQVVRAYRLLGRTYAVLGKTQQATDAFQKLLTYQPDEKSDPSQTPRIQDAFSEAQGLWAGYPTKPSIDASTVALRVHLPGTIRVRLHDPTHQIKKVVVGYRWGGSGPFTVAEQPPAETINVDVQPGPATVSRLDYYADALDGMDDQALVAGDQSTPKTAIADMPASGGPSGTGAGAIGSEQGGGHSIFASPVFWIVTGVVLAGAATGTFFALHKGPSNAANLSPILGCEGTPDGRCH
jgi:hypothetical protein